MIGHVFDLCFDSRNGDGNERHNIARRKRSLCTRVRVPSLDVQRINNCTFIFIDAQPMRFLIL